MAKNNKQSSNDDEQLLSQIESVNVDDATTRDLGHVDVNRAHRLSSEEEDSRRAFNERAQQAFTQSTTGDFAQGWVDIDKREMGERAKYYPEGWEFRIKPADVATIKNWSAVNEEYAPSVNATLNEVLKTCVQITTPTGRVSWSQLNSYDRFWFVLKIRELTFSRVESKIEFDDECVECNETAHFELTPQALWYDMPDDEIFEKHYNAEDRMWYINPREYDVDAPVVKLYQPTLEKDDAILNWMMSRVQQHKSINESFVKYLPWLLKKPSKDEQMFERQVSECEFTYKSWGIDMFNFMESVLTNIIITPQDTLSTVCPHCGMEVHSSIKFPDGIKNLFATASNGHKKFGSK